MSIRHEGYVVVCDFCHDHDTRPEFATDAKTERTAIAHAREAQWFIGRVRITAGGQGGRRVVLCPGCRWVIGAKP